MDLGSLSIKPKNFLFKSVFLFSFPPTWYKFREVTTGSCWHLSLAGKRATSIKQINCYQHLSLIHLSIPSIRHHFKHKSSPVLQLESQFICDSTQIHTPKIRTAYLLSHVMFPPYFGPLTFYYGALISWSSHPSGRQKSYAFQPEEIQFSISHVTTVWLYLNTFHLLQKYFDRPTEVLQPWQGAQRTAHHKIQEEEPYSNWNSH